VGAVTRLLRTTVQWAEPKVLTKLMEQAKARATKAISIRLPISDTEFAKQIARAEGVGYQSVLKKAIRRG
jgi:predicted DNA binding CopG/RHH family protein